MVGLLIMNDSNGILTVLVPNSFIVLLCDAAQVVLFTAAD
jgi:hypothetical protein